MSHVTLSTVSQEETRESPCRARSGGDTDPARYVGDKYIYLFIIIQHYPLSLSERTLGSPKGAGMPRDYTYRGQTSQESLGGGTPGGMSMRPSHYVR